MYKITNNEHKFLLFYYTHNKCGLTVYMYMYCNIFSPLY